MKSNWTIKTLSEVCTKIGSGQTPRGGKESYKGGRFALVRSQNIHNQGFTENGLVYINDAQADQLSNVEIQSNDVFINITGHSVTRCCMVPDEILPARVNQHVAILRADNKFLDGGFLRYFLISPKIQRRLISLSSGGATRKALTKSMLESFEIVLPTLLEQKSIAHILETFDQKIVLNNKTNKHLEEIAKALFKSWFIDFDPVRAKAEDRSTGLPDEISDLFPDSFEDSELGKIPENWVYKNIGDTFETSLGGTPSRNKSEYWDGNIPWIGSGMLNAFRVTKETEFITELGLANSSTKLLPKRSTLIAITGATLGQISINEIEVCANQSVVAIKPCEKISPEFVFLWVQKNVDFLINSQTGGAQQHINKNNVNEMKILLPNKEIIEIFGNIVKPIFDKISNNLFESDNLSNLRNQMLPKLISGELKIPDAEKIIEEVRI